MPQVQVVDTTERAPEPTGVEQFFSKLGKSMKEEKDRVEIGKLLSAYQENREDANAWEDLQLGLEKSTVSPTKRLQTQQSLNDMKRVMIERDKALNARVNKGILTEEEKQRQKENLIKAGWPEYAADQYLDAPPGVKGTLEREHAALTERGLRKPLVSVPEGVDTTRPPTAPSLAPLENEWPEPITPRNLTQAERVKWENSNEKENNKLLKETNDRKKVLRTNESAIKTMQKTNDGGYLPSGFGKLLIIDPETGDIRPSAQLAKIQNPQTELYVKNLKQWLRGAKDFFGARVTNFDVQAFMAQLPSLLNSEQGRRLILKQMEYNNELESLHNNTLNKGLKHYGRDANFSQISSEVDEKTSAKEDELIGKINNLVDASDYINLIAENPEKFSGMTVMQTPDGSFRAVPREKVAELKKKNWRDF